jgi:hypothetical protein
MEANCWSTESMTGKVVAVKLAVSVDVMVEPKAA